MRADADWCCFLLAYDVLLSSLPDDIVDDDDDDSEDEPCSLSRASVMVSD